MLAQCRVFDQCDDCTIISEQYEPSFNCMQEVTVGSLCSFQESGDENNDHFYKIGSFTEDGISSLYLLTNC